MICNDGRGERGRSLETELRGLLGSNSCSYHLLCRRAGFVAVVLVVVGEKGQMVRSQTADWELPAKRKEERVDNQC